MQRPVAALARYRVQVVEPMKKGSLRSPEMQEK